MNITLCLHFTYGHVETAWDFHLHFHVIHLIFLMDCKRNLKTEKTSKTFSVAYNSLWSDFYVKVQGLYFWEKFKGSDVCAPSWVPCLSSAALQHQQCVTRANLSLGNVNVSKRILTAVSLTTRSFWKSLNQCSH